ncbi:hypothetical protein AWV80_13610 [Cupriavidus sp. UYMU48A]|nr:hypothetical protein AWV80_13610 [Cupriavidus sp. UYMU48A]
MTDFLVAPDGKRLRKVASRTTTVGEDTIPKPVDIAREYVEVLILDGRAVSRGSQWGHVAIEIDGLVYSRADKTYFTGSYRDYLLSQTRKAWIDANGRERGMHRDGTGFLLWVTPGEKAAMLAELERRVKRSAEYNLFTNSCSTNVAQVLSIAAIVSKDPRYFDTPVSPKEMFMMLGRSSRLVERRDYRKGWEGGASGNW